MPERIRVISPVDGSLYAERDTASGEVIDRALATARTAQSAWKTVPASERAAICRPFAQIMLSQKEALGEEITWQMGRPIRYSPFEIVRMAERVETMCSLAATSLADVVPESVDGSTRFIRREPLGVVFTISPWNYPYLTAVSTVVPALLAGNAVLLKHSPQTPLCAERMAEAFSEAGLPAGVFQFLHLSDEDAERVVRCGDIDHVVFTGSVQTGRRVQTAARERFIGVGLELGGKDPAYVRADANLDHAAENVIDGAVFNSGQSCCAVERVYVHTAIYDDFVKRAAAITSSYVLGNPLDPDVTLGPLVSERAAERVRGQVDQAVAAGAKALVDGSQFPTGLSPAYMAPQLLGNVDHSMPIMREETFGPVLGIMKVDSDEEAVRLMNDSHYGLSASIWTQDEEAALSIGEHLECGTVFMNRCDYLDPALAWTGVKNSGRGCSLSSLAFEQLTRPKSYHLRTQI